MMVRAPSRPRPYIWVAILAFPVAIACGSAHTVAPSPEAIETAESVSATVSISAPVSTTPEKGDDEQPPVELNGRVFGRGPIGVILVHGRPADQTAWFPFATKLAAVGRYTVLTFNFRGYPSSSGEKEFDRIDTDLIAAYDYMHSDLNVGRIFLVGASMGATASLAVGAEKPVGGVVSISTLQTFPPLDALQSVAEVEAPKLFVTSRDDVPQAKTEEELWAAAPDPKEQQIYDGDAHGTDLFESPHADELSALVIDFLGRH